MPTYYHTVKNAPRSVSSVMRRKNQYLTTNTSDRSSVRKSRKRVHVFAFYWLKVTLIIKGKRGCSYVRNRIIRISGQWSAGHRNDRFVPAA